VKDIKDKTDNELVALIRENPESLSFVIDRYKNKLERYINRRTNISIHDREDILQEIFIKIYININDYDNGLTFSSWIYRITHNHMIDWYRKNKKHISISLDDEESKLIHMLEDENNRVDNQVLHDQENLDLIMREIKKLPQDYQEILILKFFEDKSYNEISDILKISLSSIGVKINRAKKILKQKIYA
jgi:RNA polymerase sigma-70 factor (ECF subfamily)